jgi:hypothetical protein
MRLKGHLLSSEISKHPAAASPVRLKDNDFRRQKYIK